MHEDRDHRAPRDAPPHRPARAGRPLTRAERTLLDVIVDRLVPEDEHGPGAAGLGVADYVASALTSGRAEIHEMYAEGLSALDQHARLVHGAPFCDLSPAQQDALLVDMERGRIGGTDGAAFFDRLWSHVIEGLFGDPAWGGNRDGAGWALIGYPGPRAVWTDQEQQLDVAPGPPAGSAVSSS